jgi:hypothetical protein
VCVYNKQFVEKNKIVHRIEKKNEAAHFWYMLDIPGAMVK